MIFIFLGLSTFSRNHSWDFVFTLVTVIACLGSRFIGTYILSYICNKYRDEKIGLVDQFIIAYGNFKRALLVYILNRFSHLYSRINTIGGLRGAICYGLGMLWDQIID